MSSGPIKVIFGAAGFGNRDPYVKDEDIKELFSVLKSHNVDTIDTAQLYGNSEQRLGEVNAGADFTFDTKWKGGFGPDGSVEDLIIAKGKESIETLKVKQVDIFYIHAPIKSRPLEETLDAVNEVYKTGIFKRFGVSNFAAEDVQNAYDYSKSKGYVLPTVYQGNYSPVARLQETLLFPTLRKLGISFYAYSPLAGGFLTKTAQQIQDGIGRFSEQQIGGLYRTLYNKPSYLDALEKWQKIAKEEGVSAAELAYRWVASDSPLSTKYGDAIIVGASSIKQVDETITGIQKGKLSDKALKGIDEIWEGIKHEAPLDNYNR